MNWSNEQQQAIDQRGKNLLVAAAAGSGKTAVLVERIKKLIIEDGVPIDRMLIVTFTNAAAAEMREKIRVAINKEIEEDPMGMDAAELRKQLNLLPKANISTFHAFALEVIRNFFFMTDLEPGFSICDDAQRTLIKEDSLDVLMEQCFESESEEFYSFLDWYAGDRNQNKVREIIDSSYNVLQSLPYPWQWLDEKISELSMDEEEFKDSYLMDYVWALICDSFSEARDYSESAANVLSEAGLDRLAEKVQQQELDLYEELAETADRRDFDKIAELLKAFSSLRLAASGEEKETYAEVKELVAACRKKASTLVKDIEKMFFTQEFSEMVDEINLTAPKAETLRKLLEDFDKIFKEAKAEKKLVDFNDIEHCCLSVLGDEQAAAYYRDKFEYIFIDEYQDTNILQEEIISKVKRENNLFMVGDIKQSIYKFRLAEPEIFQSKYAVYGSGEDVNSAKIDLNRNFRSKPPVISAINDLFEPLMEGYDDAARLYAGVDYDGPYNYSPKIKIVDTSTVEEGDEELEGLKAAELEALEAVNIIKENLGRRYFDHKAGVEKEIGLRDIVILMRGVRNYADVFSRIMKSAGIDSFLDDSEGYFDTMEINVFLNLLSVIDNKQQDVPLISVLHSEIFGFSADELGRVRAAFKDGSYSKAFISYGSDGVDGPLKEKCKAALDSIARWKSMAGSLPLGKFIWKLLLDTGYYIEMGAMPAGAQRQANLRALVDKAEKFAADHQGSLYGFIRYIGAVKERNVAMGQVKLVGENDDLVRIMTIHKSKGLEFPMVILCGCGRRLNYTKIGSGVALHKDIGLGMTLCNFEEHWYKQTLLQRLIQKQVRREEVCEEIRILYVAATRAKDILYLTGTVKDGEKYMESRQLSIAGETMYLDMLGGLSNVELITADRLPSLAGAGRALGQSPLNADIFEDAGSTEDADEVIGRLEFVYPHQHSDRLKSKYSVTEIFGKGDFEKVLAVPAFRAGKGKISAAQRGTIYHGIMERIDFDRAAKEGLSYIKEATEDLVWDEIFTEDEVASVNLSRIAEFFESDLGKRAAEAFDRGSLLREKPFDLQMEMEGETVIVQGIIDCCFEEAGEYVLLDYKTNWIDPKKPREAEEERLRSTYAGQIDIYSKAIEEALGKAVKESYLYLFHTGTEVKMK